MFIAYWITLFYFAYILQLAICNETPETTTPTTNVETEVDSVAELVDGEEESTVDPVSVPTTRRLTEENLGKNFKKGKKVKKVKDEETDIDVNVVNANQDTKTDIKQIFVFEDSSDNEKKKTYRPEHYEKYKREKNLRHHDDEYYYKYPHRPNQKYCEYPTYYCADYYKNHLKCPYYCKNRYDRKYHLCKPQCKDYYRCYEKCPSYCKNRYHQNYVSCPWYCKYDYKKHDDDSSSSSSSSYDAKHYDGVKYPKGYKFTTEKNTYRSKIPFKVNIKENDEYKEVTINGKTYYYKNDNRYKKHDYNK